MATQLEQLLNYSFKDKDLLKEALTHKSFAAQGPFRHNERLEFLGDSVLGAVVADYVYSRRPEVEEGVLSKIKSSLVSRKNLYLWAAGLELGRFLKLGAGEESSGGRERESILSNAMEAVIGAVYLDGGFAAVQQICLPWLETQRLEIDGEDYKSALQEYFQKKGKPTPQYEVLQTVGPEHDKVFTVGVFMHGEELARGKGKNKKIAEQQAAQKALDSIK